jgi:hypothetical protein
MAHHARTGVLIIVVLVALSAAPVRAEVIDRVMAVVAGDLILMSDVVAARELRLVPVSSGIDNIREVLSRLIDRSLMLAEVERYAPPEPDRAAVDTELQIVKSKFSSAAALDATLTRAGLDEHHLRETLRQDLRLRAYLDQRFTTGPLADEEVGRFYREHPAAFTRNGTVQPFETVRPDVVRAATAERRRTVVEEWLAGLRRRAEISDLYVTDPR